MRRKSVFARFTATCLCTIAFGLLASCTSLKPRAPVPTPPPLPPRVDCNAGPAATLPPIPPLVEMDVWAAAVMGLYQGEVTKRHAEHACLDALRAKGVIR